MVSKLWLHAREVVRLHPLFPFLEVRAEALVIRCRVADVWMPPGRQSPRFPSPVKTIFELLMADMAVSFAPLDEVV
jgi:hypothetical protein